MVADASDAMSPWFVHHCAKAFIVLSTVPFDARCTRAPGGNPHARIAISCPDVAWKMPMTGFTIEPGASEAGAGTRASRVIFALVTNAIPLIGVLNYGWSAINVLALYWLEILLVSVSTVIRLLVQRKRMQQRQPRDSDNASASNGVNQFGLLFNGAMTAFVLFEGIFVIIAAAMFAHRYPNDPMWRFSFSDLSRGAALLVALYGIDLLAGLRKISSEAGTWDRSEADRRIRRVGVLHMSLWFGLVALKLLHSRYGLLVALVTLKTATDVLIAMGWQGWTRRREPTL